jgi:hypothetical protein
MFERQKLGRGRLLAAGLLCSSLLSLVWAAPAQSAPMLTVANGVMNPPPNVPSTTLNPLQVAVADTAALIPVASFGPALQSLLTMQGFSAANNWTLNTNLLTLANNATFNVTQYNLRLNATGDGFGEVMNFTLNPNLAAPMNPPAGSTVTEHWLQIFNMSMSKANGFPGTVLGAPNNQGFWYIDNGFVAGAMVDGTNNGAGTNNGHNGPYYDSNNVPATSGMTFSVPPTFVDTPGFFSGGGFFIHFDAIPVWDVFTPAANGKPATDAIDVGNFGVGWGFSIVAVPEPSTVLLLTLGLPGLAVCIRQRRNGLSP